MDKIKTHFKNNAAIYLILFTCIVVILITLFITNKPKKSNERVDTSLFTVVNLDGALSLFNDNSPKFLLMSVYNCSATINYVPYLKIASAQYGFPIYYLELTEIDTSREEFQELRDKLDLEYNFQGNIDKFSKFIENTPLTVIIKNKKMVYGRIGSMNLSTLKSIADNYGLTNS